MRDRLIVVAGPTASGKTAAAVDLALALDGELIGADSVQVYRRLDIGAARPRPEELRGIPHHLLGVAGITESFDAARYVTLADAAVAGIRGRGRVPIVVGGTGLYLRALVHGLAEGIPADPAVRALLHTRIAAGGPDELARMHHELATVDPDYAARIHPADPIRVVRGLEVWTLSGVPLSVHHRRHQAQGPRYDVRFLALAVDRAVLRHRIAARTRAMLAAGWLDEVRGILAEGHDPGLKPLRSVGYAQVVAHLRGELAGEALEPAVVQATAAFAKRQRTWFRGEPGVTWLPPEALGMPEVREDLRRFMEGGPAD